MPMMQTHSVTSTSKTTSNFHVRNKRVNLHAHPNSWRSNFFKVVVDIKQLMYEH